MILPFCDARKTLSNAIKSDAIALFPGQGGQAASVKIASIPLVDRFAPKTSKKNVTLLRRQPRSICDRRSYQMTSTFRRDDVMTLTYHTVPVVTCDISAVWYLGVWSCRCQQINTSV